MTTSTDSVADILRPLALRDDSRFDALRMGIERGNFGEEHALDTSLGAIVRAAAECGLYVSHIYDDGNPPAGRGHWMCFLSRPFPEEGGPFGGNGETPEIAAARALVTAIGDT